MTPKSFVKDLFAPIALSLLILTSCQKEIDSEHPAPVPPEANDSTQLIKSITFVHGNSSADSIVEYYSYDTLNKKITLTWDDASRDIPDGSRLELMYNSKGLLAHASYHYPAGYVPDEHDFNTIDLIYDSENILKETIVKYGDGSIDSTIFEKELYPDGNYGLAWDESDDAFSNEVNSRMVLFNSKGKCLINLRYHLYIENTLPDGTTFYNSQIRQDSLVYDAAGNILSIHTTESQIRTSDFDELINTDAYPKEHYVAEEFLGRQTRGNQLYNQRCLIMNGIAGIPFQDGDNALPDAFGILSFTLDYEHLQYSNFPIQSAKVRMWDGSYKNFTAGSSFDDKDRLVKFIGFFNDLDLKTQEYRINYY